jgi:hypothetical protein
MSNDVIAENNWENNSEGKYTRTSFFSWCLYTQESQKKERKAWKVNFQKTLNHVD